MGELVIPGQPKRPKATERMVLDSLKSRYDKLSQGVSLHYVFARQVRNDAGYNAERSADALAMDLWPSSGLAIHGFEVKVSRSDWLQELKQPEKAEAFTPYCDYWWVVAPATIVKVAELPMKWGLMTYGEKGVRVTSPAPRQRPLPMPKGLMAAFLRAVYKEARRG